MPKRKAKELDSVQAPAGEPRRSSRRKSSTKQDSAAPELTEKRKPRKPIPGEANGDNGDNGETEDYVGKPAKRSKAPIAATSTHTTSDPPPSGRQYWLMKAEPESRLEKGHDVKFSIDDLASRTKPEPWDGIRAYPARNNLRAMKKGDYAFFYHSSCKVPAIVGIMEIVEEHSPDRKSPPSLSPPPFVIIQFPSQASLSLTPPQVSAHDPEAPYHDPSSDPASPKWSLVHVAFRQKLETPITLKDLRAFQAESGSPLQNMQMLKLTRLSVSRVSDGEWAFLTSVMEKNGDKIL